tara:strand:- start:142 stop:357 length:216 start_codon:yes stop_codon:yes gene_type:complete
LDFIWTLLIYRQPKIFLIKYAQATESNGVFIYKSISNPLKRFRNSQIKGRRYAYGIKDEAAQGNPLKSQEN